MPRNFFRRIEAVFPIEDPRLRRRLKQELLAIPMADNVKAWNLQPDGSYERVREKNSKFVRSQVQFMKRALRAAKQTRSLAVGRGSAEP
jgi:polyphosphate kinase